jgi:hypothetical protein
VIEEFPQTSPNLTSSTQNLLDLIDAQRLLVYPDPAIRLAMSRAIAVETPRGLRISKDKQAHRIDVIVALAMACLAAVQSQRESTFDSTFAWLDHDDANPAPAKLHVRGQGESESRSQCAVASNELSRLFAKWRQSLRPPLYLDLNCAGRHHVNPDLKVT